MPTLKTSDFKNVPLGPTRTCPECEENELEITGNPNIFECNYCGSKWERLEPFKKDNGEVTKIPEKLKRLLKEEKL